MSGILTVIVFAALFSIESFAGCLSDYRREVESHKKFKEMSISELTEVANEYQMKHPRPNGRKDMSDSWLFNIGRKSKSLVKAYLAIVEAEQDGGAIITTMTRDVSLANGFKQYEATVIAYILTLDRIDAFCSEGELLTYEEMVLLIANQI